MQDNNTTNPHPESANPQFCPSFTPMLKRLQISDWLTALACCVIIALFTSRAALSVCTGLFAAAALWSGRKQLWPLPKEHRVMIFLFAGLFLLPFLSGLWSQDMAEWWRRCQVKLPLLLLPAAVALCRFSTVQLFGIQLLFIFCVLCGTAFSMFEYLLQPNAVEAGYDTARVMPTLLSGDHIRFSWLVVIAIIFLLQIQGEMRRPRQRVINIIIMIWLAAYLHILSAKTGLLMFYTVLPLWLLHRLRKGGKKWWWAALAVLLAAPFIAYKTIPTFKKRVDYIRYDFAHYSRGVYRGGLSDAARIVSVKAGTAVWLRQPLTGVGMGDVEMATQQWYSSQAAYLKEYERILPSSQLLLYAAGCGVAGLLALLAALLWPLVQSFRQKQLYALLYWLAVIPGFLFEIHLESQYGVFIFCFFACWFSMINKTPPSSA